MKVLTSEKSGFTLLEVVVAMTLLATVGMAVFSWINASLESLYRVEQHTLKERGSRVALALLSSRNPMDAPTGEQEFGAFVIHWQGELIEPIQPGKSSLGATGLYELGLYDVDVHIEVNGQPLTDFSLKQVGYRQTREFSFVN